MPQCGLALLAGCVWTARMQPCEERHLATTEMVSYGTNTDPTLPSLGIDAVYITAYSPLEGRRARMQRRMDRLGLQAQFVTGWDQEQLTDKVVGCMYPSNALFARTARDMNFKLTWMRLGETQGAAHPRLRGRRVHLRRLHRRRRRAARTRRWRARTAGRLPALLLMQLPASDAGRTRTASPVTPHSAGRAADAWRVRVFGLTGGRALAAGSHALPRTGGPANCPLGLPECRRQALYPRAVARLARQTWRAADAETVAALRAHARPVAVLGQGVPVALVHAQRLGTYHGRRAQPW
mmetsp:Transcript_34344/g.85595  ORF Transcript_34344/g.85595 Transcript_34344/m.85595 type:complete len:295 (-) Transcript_34344:321-1205(-)